MRDWLYVSYMCISMLAPPLIAYARVLEMWVEQRGVAVNHWLEDASSYPVVHLLHPNRSRSKINFQSSAQHNLPHDHWPHDLGILTPDLWCWPLAGGLLFPGPASPLTTCQAPAQRNETEGNVSLGSPWTLQTTALAQSLHVNGPWVGLVNQSP